MMRSEPRPARTEQLEVGRDPKHRWPHHQRLQRGVVAVAGLVLLAAAGAGTVELLRGDDGRSANITPPSRQPRPPEDVMAMRVQTMNGFREVRFHGVGAVVPSYWGRNNLTDCGVPYADTVLRPNQDVATRPCDSSMSDRHSYLAFTSGVCPNRSSLQRDDALTRRLGAPVGVTRLHRTQRGFSTHIEYGRPASCVEVSSPYRAVVERIVGTLRPAAPPVVSTEP